MPDTLTDRSIVIAMQRRTKDQRVERFRVRRAMAEAKPILDSAASFARAHQGAIEQAYERLEDLEFLGDRDADLWGPLFVVCAVSAPDRVAELKKCAVTLSGAKAGDDAEDSLSLKLLGDIRAAWPEGQKEWDTASLIAALKALEESPWAEFGLSPHKVARMLRPFDIAPRSIRIGKSTPKGYVSVQMEAAFARYLIDESATSTQPA